MEPLISVIIPVHNEEKHLERCLGSVIEQSFRKLEIIAVDDGSTDSSSRILSSMKAKDSRIIVVHRENGGLSAARNTGIQHAHGEWISFVDSDDYIEPDMIACACRAVSSQAADMCIFEYATHDVNGQAEPKDYAPVRGLFSPDESMVQLLEDHEITNHVWRRLVRANIVRKHPFPEGKLFEDAYVVPAWTNESGRICCIDDVLYHYCRHAGTLTDTGSMETVREQLDAYRYKRDLVQCCRPALKEAADMFYCKSIINVFRDYVWMNRKKNPAEYRAFKGEISELLRRTDAWKGLPAGYRRKAYVLSRYPWLTESVFGLYDTLTGK